MRFTIFLVAAALLLCNVQAQLSCSGLLTAPNPVTSDVTVSGAGTACTIFGVNVTGSVTVTGGASLVTSGSVRIFGSVRGEGADGSISLGGGTVVSGGVSVNGLNSVTVGPNADVGSLMIVGVASTVVNGKTALITTSGAGTLSVFGGSIVGGGLQRKNAEGGTILCGATLTGGISLEAVKGDFSAVASPNCGPSSLSGSIIVGKGTGSVLLSGGMLLGADLIVGEQTGDVQLSNAHLSDVSIGSLSGKLTLINVIADSDGTVSGVKGDVSVSGSKFAGDFTIFGTEGAVTLDNNDFGLEDIGLNGNKGLVTVKNNVNLSFVATENSAGLIVANNKITNAMISKNSVQVTITDSSFQSLSCADNSPPPTGAQNSVVISDGQCAGF